MEHDLCARAPQGIIKELFFMMTCSRLVVVRVRRMWSKWCARPTQRASQQNRTSATFNTRKPLATHPLHTSPSTRTSTLPSTMWIETCEYSENSKRKERRNVVRSAHVAFAVAIGWAAALGVCFLLPHERTSRIPGTSRNPSLGKAFPGRMMAGSHDGAT